MEKHEINKFARMMATIGALYDKNLPEAVIEIYWQSLQHFDFAIVACAMRTHVENPDNGQFLPKPADIIRLLEGSSTSKAANAWAQVDKAIAEIGSYTSVAFDDCRIHAVIEKMGGWIRLCQSTTAQLNFSRIEFQKHYQGLLTQAPKRHPKTLTGRIEAENRYNNNSLPPPTLIGDKQQAQQVISTGGGITLDIHHPSTDNNTISQQHTLSRT